MKNYNSNVDLAEILESLSLYCIEAGVPDPKVTVILPKEAIEAFNLSMAKKRAKKNVIALNGSKVSEINQDGNFKLLSAGVVELLANDEVILNRI